MRIQNVVDHRLVLIQMWTDYHHNEKNVRVQHHWIEDQENMNEICRQHDQHHQVK